MIDKIFEWRRTMGMPVQESTGLFRKDRIDLALKLMREEFNELEIAVHQKDLEGTADGIVDLIVTTCQLIDEIGLNLPKSIDTVYESLMSKTCNKETAIQTCLTVQSKGIECDYEEIVEGSGIYRIVRNDGKILKPNTFQEPDWSWLTDL